MGWRGVRRWAAERVALSLLFGFGDGSDAYLNVITHACTKATKLPPATISLGRYAQRVDFSQHHACALAQPQPVSCWKVGQIQSPLVINFEDKAVDYSRDLANVVYQCGGTAWNGSQTASLAMRVTC